MALGGSVGSALLAAASLALDLQPLSVGGCPAPRLQAPRRHAAQRQAGDQRGDDQRGHAHPSLQFGRGQGGMGTV